MHSCYRGSKVATIPLAVATRNRGQHDPLLNRADALISPAPRNRDAYAAARPDLTPKLHVVPDFAPDPGPNPPPEPGRPWLYVGRLSPEKGIVDLLRAWPQRNALIVAGSGPDDARARRAAAGKDVTFLGQQTPAEVQRLLRESRALVFPSMVREGGIAMTYVEALAAGRPVVAVGSHTVADDVRQSGAGVVVRSFHEVAAALARVEAHTREASRLARLRYEQEFSEASWQERIGGIYEQATS